MASILYVEDEPIVMLGLTMSLEDAGHDVTTVSNGRRALALIEGGLRTDLVITDYMMPVMDGPALILALRARPEFRRVPILLVSAVPESELPDGIDYDAYLAKPFLDRMVLESVNALLRGRG
jgi:CheY-like chemotaxis protein